MGNLKIALGLLIVALADPAIAAEPVRMALACKGESVQDFKSFNLPAKTTQETRIYVIDEAGKSVTMLSNGELIPLCDKATPDCRVEVLPAGIQIDFHTGEESLKVVFNRKANTWGEQSENAARLITFEGQCQPTELPAVAPEK